jgi:hypothetical protein
LVGSNMLAEWWAMADVVINANTGARVLKLALFTSAPLY